MHSGGYAAPGVARRRIAREGRTGSGGQVEVRGLGRRQAQDQKAHEMKVQILEEAEQDLIDGFRF